VSVHHIDVNAIGTCPLGFRHLLAKTGEVGGEN
jgi:hypothetical protein